MSASGIRQPLSPKEDPKVANARRTLAVTTHRRLWANRIAFVAILGAVILSNAGIPRSWPIFWPLTAMFLIGASAAFIHLALLVKESRAERLVRKVESEPQHVVDTEN